MLSMSQQGQQQLQYHGLSNTRENNNDPQMPLNRQQQKLSKRQEVMLLRYTQLKLQRNTEQVDRLKEILARDRIFSSSRSLKIMEFTELTTDYFIPAIWGQCPTELNRFKLVETQKKKLETQNRVNNGGCCVIM